MRIAALITGLFIGLISFLQSCALAGVMSISQELGGTDPELETAIAEAGTGLLIALLAILGAAFAIGRPTVAMVLFGIGAVIGIAFGSNAETFDDLSFWGIAMILPTALAFLGRREVAATVESNSESVALKENTPVDSDSSSDKFCTQCGFRIITDARYCRNCGAAAI